MSERVIDSEVCALLRRTAAELSRMTLRDFRELCYYHGFDVRMQGVTEPAGRLSIRIDPEHRPIVFIDNIPGASAREMEP